MQTTPDLAGSRYGRTRSARAGYPPRISLPARITGWGDRPVRSRRRTLPIQRMSDRAFGVQNSPGRRSAVATPLNR